MIIARSISELRSALDNREGSVGFVPTMGALHIGHRSLIEAARKENNTVVVSIFVNPTQFLPGEDLSQYPRREEADFKICELSGVDVLFYPDVNAMYGEDEVRICAPDVRGFILEGSSRPARVYFGKKDAQHLALITQMCHNFFMNIEIVPMETVRESDGLALSSRNIYLNSSERQEALKLSAALKRATKMLMQGNTKSAEIKEAMEAILEPLDVEYVAIVNRAFESIDEVVTGNTIVLVAARVGTTRLIDNVWM